MYQYEYLKIFILRKMDKYSSSARMFLHLKLVYLVLVWKNIIFWNYLLNTIQIKINSIVHKIIHIEISS